MNSAEWAVIESVLEGPSKLGRPPRFARRAVLNAILYLVRTGGSWRLLPYDRPPWRIVSSYFARWRAEGLWQRMHDALRDAARVRGGQKKPPSSRLQAASAIHAESSASSSGRRPPSSWAVPRHIRERRINARAASFMPLAG